MKLRQGNAQLAAVDRVAEGKGDVGTKVWDGVEGWRLKAHFTETPSAAFVKTWWKEILEPGPCHGGRSRHTTRSTRYRGTFAGRQSRLSCQGMLIVFEIYMYIWRAGVRDMIGYENMKTGQRPSAYSSPLVENNNVSTRGQNFWLCLYKAYVYEFLKLLQSTSLVTGPGGAVL